MLENLPLLFLGIVVGGVVLMRWIGSNIQYKRDTAWERERKDVVLRQSLKKGKGR